MIYHEHFVLTLLITIFHNLHGYTFTKLTYPRPRGKECSDRLYKWIDIKKIRRVQKKILPFGPPAPGRIHTEFNVPIPPIGNQIAFRFQYSETEKAALKDNLESLEFGNHDPKLVLVMTSEQVSVHPNASFVGEFGYTEQNLRHIFDVFKGGVLPWFADVLAHVLETKEAVLEYLRLVSLKVGLNCLFFLYL